MINLGLKGRDHSRKKKKEKHTSCNKATWQLGVQKRRCVDVIMGTWNWRYLAVDQKLCVGKGRSQVQCQVTERSNWNKHDDVNRNSQKESAKRKKR